MNLKEAIELIAFENVNSAPQLWLDLGCGTGLFTLALVHYLPAASKIIAIDTDIKALEKLPAIADQVLIETRALDFVNDPLNIQAADGVLMANSLHYVIDKEMFLKRLATSLKREPVFLLVEYDRQDANPWVPYPIGIDAAKNLFYKSGYNNFKLLSKRRSVYGGHSMYAASICR